jgi:hypothetical protein
MQQWGSVVVQGIPAVGLILAGGYRRTGWLICLLGQVAAVTFGLSTGMIGYLAWAPVYVVIYVSNWIRWNKKERGKDAGSVCDLRHRRDDCVDAR